MELVAIAFMLVGGAALAIFVMVAYAINQRAEQNEARTEALPATEKERIAASLLFAVVKAAGGSDDDSIRVVRRGAGLVAPVTRGIDVSNWAESYANLSTQEQRSSLLETAVQLIANHDKPIPLRQYATLLDLSFGLGFQTDALARLREIYGFEYVDHAKDARPRSADRGGGAAPLYVRTERDATALLRILGLPAEASRRDIIAAYRRLVAQHHPDRFHGSSVEEQSGAAQRFIEITKAYEELLVIYRD
jgi:DnaJ-domain-containing protein 1